MLKIVKQNGGKKYLGNKEVTNDEVNKITKVFKTKFEAFIYGVENNWSKQSIMEHCLDTKRDQYFYNYYIKYLGLKK